METKLQVVVFRPNKYGEVQQITRSEISEIVGSPRSTFPVQTDVEDVLAIAGDDAMVLGMKWNRGFFGTFVVCKEGEGGSLVSLMDEEVSKIKKVLDNKKNFLSKNRFLSTFFKEKDLPGEMFMYERGHNIIHLSNYQVIEAMLASEDTDFLKKVEMTLREIDFVNGKVNHFLEHMGRGMADEISEHGSRMFQD